MKTVLSMLSFIGPDPISTIFDQTAVNCGSKFQSLTGQLGGYHQLRIVGNKLLLTQSVFIKQEVTLKCPKGTRTVIKI